MTDSAGSMTANHDSPLSGVICFQCWAGARDLGLVQKEDRPDKKVRDSMVMAWRAGSLQGVWKNRTARAPTS